MFQTLTTPADQPSVEDRIRAVRDTQEADHQIGAAKFERLIQASANRLAAGRTTRVVRKPGK